MLQLLSILIYLAILLFVTALVSYYALLFVQFVIGPSTLRGDKPYFSTKQEFYLSFIPFYTWFASVGRMWNKWNEKWS